MYHQSLIHSKHKVEEFKNFELAQNQTSEPTPKITFQISEPMDNLIFEKLDASYSQDPSSFELKMN
jgi:hypothetical protein